MGFGDPSGVKNMLKMRAASAWLNKDMLKNESFREEVSFVISDLLLDVHRFGSNPKLTYVMLVKCIQNVVLRYVKAFPNLNTIVLLLDEQKYVPLGKVPTQDKRKKPLTSAERSKILDGGVISKMDANLEENIEALYSKEASVKSGRCTAFSVFFSKYIRTRELRKDLVVFIANCLMKLIYLRKVPDDVRIYIDGMSVSTYYSSPDLLFKATEDDEGTPLIKRRRSSSAVETVNYYEEYDKNHLSVCKLVWVNTDARAITLTPDHPYSSLCEDETAKERMSSDKEVAPLWLSKHDGDAEIFMGYRGPYIRPEIGESDVKIALYARRIAETLAHQMKNMEDDEEEVESGCTCYVSCWDTDSIMILLLCMKEIPPQVSQCFDILLDMKSGSSCREIIAFHDPDNLSAPSSPDATQNSTEKGGMYNHDLGRIVRENEGEYLSDIVNIQELYRGIKHRFEDLHPGVDNPVETLCLLFLLIGSDYADSLPGVGIEKLRTTFDLGGYIWLSEAISIHSETIFSSGGSGDKKTKRFHIDLDEDKIKEFINLVCRYSVPLAPLKEFSGSMRTKKSKLTSEANQKEKEIESLTKNDQGESRRLTPSQLLKVKELKKEKEDIKRQRDFLNNFLPREIYIGLRNAFGKQESKANLMQYIYKTMGITAEDPRDWKAIENGFEAVRKNRAAKKKKTLLKTAKTPEAKQKVEYMNERSLLAKYKNRDLTDIKHRTEIDSMIRRVGWNFAYWMYSPFICLRHTTHMNSMCRLDTVSHADLIARAQEDWKKKQAGDNHRIDEYFSTSKSHDTRKSGESDITFLGKRKSKLSLNGFTRINDATPQKNATPAAKDNRIKRTKITRSKDVFPASRVVIHLNAGMCV